MKKRSEVLAERASKKSPAAPSAAERTVPIPGTDAPKGGIARPGILFCDACGRESAVKDATKRPDGDLECPQCGAPVDISGPARPASSPRGDEKPSPPKEERPKGTAPPPTAYCNKCGAEWARVDGKPFPNCGHSDGFVYDPRKAESWSPPAGLPQPAKGERGKGEKTATKAPAERPPTPAEKVPDEVLASAARARPATVAVEPREGSDTLHVRVEWGKMNFSLGDHQHMTIGPFSLSIDLAIEDVRARPDLVRSSGEALVNDLEKIADHAFDSQIEWFKRKLSRIS